MKTFKSAQNNQTPDLRDRYLSKDEVASILAVTTRTIETYMRDGRLPYFKISRSVRFKLADVEAHLDATCRVSTLVN